MKKLTRLPPAVVVELWNRVAEDTGTLTRNTVQVCRADS